MPSVVVIILKIGLKSSIQLTAIFADMKIYILIFHGTPNPFDHDIVHGPAFAVHADADAMIGKQAGKIIADVLGALVRIKDLLGVIFTEGNSRSQKTPGTNELID